MKNRYPALLLLVFCGPLLVKAAGAATIAVYPTGVAATDVQNIQAAVDQCGDVTLKATTISGVPQRFELGNDTIAFSCDVTVLGEKAHGTQTELHGGTNAFSDLVDNLNVTIRGIYFNSPANSAIGLVASRNVTISDNRISGAQRFGIISAFSNGIVQITGNQMGDSTNPVASPWFAAISCAPEAGSVLIANNVVTAAPAPAGGGVGFGWGIRVASAGPTVVGVNQNVVYATNRRASVFECLIREDQPPLAKMRCI